MLGIYLPTTQPLPAGVNASLYGAVTSSGSKIPVRSKKVGPDDSGTTSSSAICILLISILITVIIFVAIVASYDAIRDKIVLRDKR